MIEFDNVSFKYGGSESANVLTKLSLQIEDGSFVAVLGHNGSGKSTLGKLLNGMIVPSAGVVNVFGLNTLEDSNIKKIHKMVGMVFQNPENQLVHSIVEEDVAFGPENLCLEREEIRKRVDESLNMVGMTKYAKSDTTALSGGQQQRVAIAGVLACHPKCIVFDEATSMLDPKGRHEVLDIAYELNKKEGITIIWITHLMDEILKADRAIVMNKGKIMMDDLPRKVLAHVDDMKLLGLDVPQIYQLFNRLNESDLGFDQIKKDNTDLRAISEEFDLLDIDGCIKKLDAIIRR